MLMTAPQTILCYALKGSDEQLALNAIEKIDDVNFFNEAQCTPLHLASLRPWPNAVKALLAKGALTNLKTLEGKTALHLAQAAGSIEVAECLVSHSPMLRVQGDYQGRTPLHEAARTNKLNFLACYLNLHINHVLVECDVNVQDNKKSTPLHEATKNGHEDVVRLLLEHNANPQLCDEGAYKPLAYAQAFGFVGIASALKAKSTPTLFDLAALQVVAQHDISEDLPESVFAQASSSVSLTQYNLAQQVAAEKEVLAARQAAIKKLSDEAAMRKLDEGFAKLGFNNL